MAGRRRRRPHIQRWAAAAALLGLLHDCCECYELAVENYELAVCYGVAISGGARHLSWSAGRGTVSSSNAPCARAASPLGAASACVCGSFSPLSEFALQVNLGQRPRKRHQRLPAATETSAAVLCTPLDVRSSGLI